LAVVLTGPRALTRRSTNMGKRGVSADEKKQRMLGMFHASRAVYTMKDIERDAPKLGIISNAVKDVLKELVCDDLVHEEKVGISTYYWSFPGELGAKKRGEAAAIRQQTARMRAEASQLRAAAAERSARDGGAGPEEGVEAERATASIAALQAQEAKLDGALEADKLAGVLDLRQRLSDLPHLKDAANRWTDNCFEVRKKFIEKFNMDAKEVDKHFEIQGLDYID